MKLPLVAVDRGGDVLIFRSVERAVGYLEAIDVRNGEYMLYDAEGGFLSAAADSDFGPVTIAEAEVVPTHQDDLRRALISFVSGVEGGSGGLYTLTLEELVARALKYPTG